MPAQIVDVGAAAAIGGWRLPADRAADEDPRGLPGRGDALRALPPRARQVSSVRRDDEPESRRAANEASVERDDAAAEQPGQRQVLRVVTSFAQPSSSAICHARVAEARGVLSPSPGIARAGRARPAHPRSGSRPARRARRCRSGPPTTSAPARRDRCRQRAAKPSSIAARRDSERRVNDEHQSTVALAANDRGPVRLLTARGEVERSASGTGGSSGSADSASRPASVDHVLGCRSAAPAADRRGSSAGPSSGSRPTRRATSDR